jgi:arsenite-transporting ATPase
MALRKILYFLKERNYDIFILDSAASGHMLRFLELPHLVRDWLNTTYKLLLKYKETGLVQFYGVTEHLLELSKGTREIMGILSDPKMTEFVMITIPEAMAVAEAEDLAGSLNRIKTPSSNLIVNMVVPPTRCAFCAIKREEQLSYLKEIEAKFANHVVVQLPLFAQSIRGVDGLNKLAQALFEA